MPHGPAFDAPETMYVDAERPWLGGYHRGGDPLSYYPKMWSWLLGAYPIHSVLDIGCGEGHSLRWFLEQGCQGEGVDGIEQSDELPIVQHDFTEGPYLPSRRFDLGWCCEFVEHVEERHIGKFLTTFMACDMLLMTHAIPGQGGHHHVNCQDSDYWIKLVEAVGFQYDHGLTRATRELVPHGYYAWSGLAFRTVR